MPSWKYPGGTMKYFLSFQKKFRVLRGRAVRVLRRVRPKDIRILSAVVLMISFLSIGGGVPIAETAFARYTVISAKDTTPAMKAEIAIAALPTDVQYPVDGRLTTRFSSYHPGIDLANDYGAKVYSYGEGKVVETRFERVGLGRAIVIDHGDGLVTEYGHLSVIMVEPGDEITMDTVIGEIGSTGNSSGNHLHFEIRDNGKPVNPLRFLPDYLR